MLKWTGNSITVTELQHCWLKFNVILVKITKAEGRQNTCVTLENVLVYTCSFLDFAMLLVWCVWHFKNKEKMFREKNPCWVLLLWAFYQIVDQLQRSFLLGKWKFHRNTLKGNPVLLLHSHLPEVGGRQCAHHDARVLSDCPSQRQESQASSVLEVTGVIW